MEQTSAAAYPNVLVSRYLRRPGRSGRTIEEARRKAEGLVAQGTQALLRFQQRDGGFNWWGNADEPTSTILTALGLVQLVHASRVVDVDRRPIERALERLKESQRADGSWVAETHLHAGNAKVGRDDFVATAYVATALLEAGEAGEQTRRAVSWLSGRLGQASEDGYALALAANALALQEPAGAATRKVVGELAARARVRPGLPGRWLPLAGTGPTGSTGDDAAVEATALAAYALLAAKAEPALARDLVAHLVARRDSRGTFGSTQATALALRVLLAADEGATGGPVEVQVVVDGGVVERVRIAPGEADLVRRVELGRHLKPGAHRVEVRATGATAELGQLAVRWALPESKGTPRPPPAGLKLELGLERSNLKVGERTAVRAGLRWSRPGPAFMLTATLPVPPGTELDPAKLDGAVRDGRLTSWRLHEGRVVVYTGAIEPGARVELEYGLVAKTAGEVTAPGGELWAYYTPGERAVTPDLKLEIAR